MLRSCTSCWDVGHTVYKEFYCLNVSLGPANSATSIYTGGGGWSQLNRDVFHKSLFNASHLMQQAGSQKGMKWWTLTCVHASKVVVTDNVGACGSDLITSLGGIVIAAAVACKTIIRLACVVHLSKIYSGPSPNSASFKATFALRLLQVCINTKRRCQSQTHCDRT